LVNEAHQQAKNILIRYRDELDAIANRLLEVETLTQAEFERIFPSPVNKQGEIPAMAAASYNQSVRGDSGENG
jgi:cell division protease FtsH